MIVKPTPELTRTETVKPGEPPGTDVKLRSPEPMMVPGMIAGIGSAVAPLWTASAVVAVVVVGVVVGAVVMLVVTMAEVVMGSETLLVLDI